MKNRVSIPMLTNLVGVQPSTINAQFEARLCIGLIEEVKKCEKYTVTYIIVIMLRNYQ